MFVARDEHEEAKIIECPLQPYLVQAASTKDRLWWAKALLRRHVGTRSLDEAARMEVLPVYARSRLLSLPSTLFPFLSSVQDTDSESVGMQSHDGTFLL